MTGRPEELLVGCVSLLLVVPWLVWILRRGVVQGRLPIGRTYVLRQERPGPFRALLASYAVALLLIAFVGVDLILHITE